MKKILLLTSLVISCSFFMNAQTSQNTQTTQGTEVSKTEETHKLAVLWTSDDLNIAERIALPYPLNAARNNMFDETVFIIWGPSAKLTMENKDIQKTIVKMQELGIRVEACLDCTDHFGATEILRELGVDVKYMRVPLTNYLKEGYHTLTF